MKKALLYGTVLIAVYLVIAGGTASGTVITDATSGATGVITAFQGRKATAGG